MQSFSAPDFEFLLFGGFSNIALSCAMEPLRDAKLRAGRQRANWVVSSIDGQPVKSSSSLMIVPDQRFAPERPGKRLVLVAGYGIREITNAALRSDLRKAARHSETVIALDSAAWLLADAGLLVGRRATIHWQEIEEFRERFPTVSVSSEGFVKSGKYYSCGGASTVLDLMFEILCELFGPETAFQASNMFMYSREKTTPSAHAFPRLEYQGSQVLQDAIGWISRTLDAPLKTAELAAKLGLSERTLHRLFLKELKVTPGKFASRFRLKQARYLAASTGLSLEQISLRCGYASGPALCRAYKTAFGETLRTGK